MTPAHMHISFDDSLSAGKFCNVTVGEPGTQGAGVMGMQGVGVSTPSAAAVAAAMVGLASDVQAPNDGMFASGCDP